MEFDEYSNKYSNLVDDCVRFSGKTSEFYHQVKIDALKQLAGLYLELHSSSVLDLGCGIGILSKLLLPFVSHLNGIDISTKSIEAAKETIPNAEFRVYDGERIPFQDSSFDLAYASCVFHHIPPAQWSQISQELFRVVRPGGIFAMLEHNPWNPLTRLVVSRCEFDEDAVLLSQRRTKSILYHAGFQIVQSPYILFTPFQGSFFRRFEKRMSWIPLGAQYIVLARKPTS